MALTRTSSYRRSARRQAGERRARQIRRRRRAASSPRSSSTTQAIARTCASGCLPAGLHPGVETMLWHYAHGKPKDQLELSGSVSTRDVATMSTDELLAELEEHHRATAAFLAAQHHQRPPRSPAD